jgi:hypothetical protein
MVQLCVSASVAWLVIGIPNRAFQIRLDPDGEGYTQAALLGVIVWTAAILTGVNILMLHFLGGPLRSVNTAAFAVGIIFTVVFAVPVYRFLAAACWKYGVAGMFSPNRMIERWRKMLPELQAASDRATSSEPHGKSDPKVDPASPHADKGGLDASAASTNDENPLRPATTAAAAGTQRTSSGRAVSGRAAHRARKKARKASGTAGS